MRRAASRLFQPAHESTRAAASLRRVFRGCFGVFIDLCIYIICRYMEMFFMDRRRRHMRNATGSRRRKQAGEPLGQASTVNSRPPIAKAASLGIIVLAGASDER